MTRNKRTNQSVRFCSVLRGKKLGEDRMKCKLFFFIRVLCFFGSKNSNGYNKFLVEETFYNGSVGIVLAKLKIENFQIFEKVKELIMFSLLLCHANRIRLETPEENCFLIHAELV